ncbi:MAG: triose-phosphate isomerase [Hellea sp.]|nr:triose-phosphate isomerase [Hellea sp.]
MLRKLIAGNWKMHGEQAWTIKPAGFDGMFKAADRSHLDVLICPPFPYVREMFAASASRNILTGGQDCHALEKGAHTGEVSAEMLADCGASYVIVGHSERRAAGDTDADVHVKAMAAKRAGITPIICVGESLAQRESGDANNIVGAQLAGSVPECLTDYVIAYEPVWAIGTGKVASVDDIKDMHVHIRGIAGDTIRILYGGSVKPGNAAEILSTENVDGALIGGASLNMADFAAIAKAA